MRLAVQWPRFGPLHLARLRAAHSLFCDRGGEIIGLETAGQDRVYRWRLESEPEPFSRVQAFPKRVFEDIRPSQMHAGTLRALDRIAPDAVAIMSYGYPDARAALAWCRQNRRVAVLMMATKADDAKRVRWREWVKGHLVREFDAAIVGGTPQREYVEALGLAPSSIFERYNSVENAYFEAAAANAQADPTPWRILPGLTCAGTGLPYFLASNRFIERKNLSQLLLAYALYRQRTRTPWPLLMLGDGPLRAGLERLVADRAIEGVTFCGFRQIDEIPAYYAFAGAFVHPARVDQWALVVNEAMASSLPVIVSTGAGCNVDLVEHGRNGYRFDPTSVAELTEIMTLIASDEVDRASMGRRSREIIRGWAPSRFAESLWRAVMAGKRSADRPPSVAMQALLGALNRLSPSVRAFHTVEA